MTPKYYVKLDDGTVFGPVSYAKAQVLLERHGGHLYDEEAGRAMNDLDKVIKMLQRSLTGKVTGQCNSRSLKMARAIERSISELRTIKDSTNG